MTISAAMRVFILVHSCLGPIALILGTLALIVPKGTQWHSRAGRGFMISMLLALVFSTPVALNSANWLLVGVTLLVIYHSFVAWRLARCKPPSCGFGRLDKKIHSIFGVAFAGFALFGISEIYHGQALGLAAIVFACISLSSTLKFGKFFHQTIFEDGDWVRLHVRGVAASMIAATTAFATVTGPRLGLPVPELVLWLGPTLLFTPIFIRFSRNTRQTRRSSSLEGDVLGRTPEGTK